MNPAKEQKSASKLMRNAASFLIAIIFTAFATGCAGDSEKKSEEEATPPAAEAQPLEDKSPESDTPVAQEEAATTEATTPTATVWPTGSLAGATEESSVKPVATEAPAEEVEELPKREVRDAYLQKPARWINEDWKNRSTWPHEKEELELEAATYAKKNFLSLYLNGAKPETVIDADAQTGTVTFNRGRGKSALCVVFGSNGKPRAHYFRVL
ncbi:MAG: hypothetical protein LBV12_04070 [Puniceicoccales bacterium]|jgi:hypothetical protein|nr:hypothetical protein [Puniceicoccales bacterium]